MAETWKGLFKIKASSGKFWTNLFKGEFDRKKFLDASDAVVICKKSYADAYETIIGKLQGKVDDSVIEELQKDLIVHWGKDDSDLAV